MGADAFHVCYGVRLEIDADDEATVEELELRRHPWQVAAKEHGLGCWWGVTTDEGWFFVLIGQMVGHYGLEGEPAGQLTNAQASAVVAETSKKLRAAGIEGRPAWHFQFEPDR